MKAPPKIIKRNPTQVVGSTAAVAMAAGAIQAHDLWSAAGYLALAVLLPAVTWLDRKLRA